MEYNKNYPTEVKTRSVVELAEPTGNVYESVVVICMRANKIARERREQLKGELEEFSKGVDTLEEVYQNEEQIEISRKYETLPKPTIVATEEFLADELYFEHNTKQSGK